VLISFSSLLPFSLPFAYYFTLPLRAECGLLVSYFVIKRIRFTSTGAYTQTIEPRLEFQADLSFAFGNDPAKTDLCIEVVVTSGGVKKLRKYQLRGIPEVWFWQISIYRLENSEYVEVKTSVWLPDLDIVHLEQCLLMDSQLDAMTAFEEKYANRFT
jgi:Uma2 family endonuclease